MVTEVLSETKDGALAPPKCTGASWVRSCLISEVIIGALGVGVVTSSYVVATSRTGFTLRAIFAGALIELSSTPMSMKAPLFEPMHPLQLL